MCVCVFLSRVLFFASFVVDKPQKNKIKMDAFILRGTHFATQLRPRFMASSHKLTTPAFDSIKKHTSIRDIDIKKILSDGYSLVTENLLHDL